MAELREEQKNYDFVQFKRPFMDELTKLASKNVMAFKLFMFLCKHMDGGNALCVSRETLSELLEVAPKTISRAVKYLKENGWLCVLKSGSSNVYIINPDVAWTSYGDQRKYCKFESKVLLSANENKAFLNSKQASAYFKTIDSDFIKNIQEHNEEYRRKVQKENL